MFDSFMTEVVCMEMEERRLEKPVLTFYQLGNIHDYSDVLGREVIGILYVDVDMQVFVDCCMLLGRVLPRDAVFAG
jgi:hypothetical protein